MKNQNAPVPDKTVLGVHRGIFMLGLVSFLTDLSSEMIFSVFSIFLTVILGASAALLGLIEGMAETFRADAAGRKVGLFALWSVPPPAFPTRTRSPSRPRDPPTTARRS